MWQPLTALPCSGHSSSSHETGGPCRAPEHQQSRTRHDATGDETACFDDSACHLTAAPRSSGDTRAHRSCVGSHYPHHVARCLQPLCPPPLCRRCPPISHCRGHSGVACKAKGFPARPAGPPLAAAVLLAPANSANKTTVGYNQPMCRRWAQRAHALFLHRVHVRALGLLALHEHWSGCSHTIAGGHELTTKKHTQYTHHQQVCIHHTNTHTHTHTYTRAHVHARTHTHLCMLTKTHTNTHTRIHTRKRTHSQTHIQTHTLSSTHAHAHTTFSFSLFLS